MRRICIIGSGVAGSTLALELERSGHDQVILLDCDSLTQSFDHNLDLDKKHSTYVNDIKTTGYGFGGSSNLWHGVLTDLDAEDYKYINSVTGKDIQSELQYYHKGLKKYFGDIDLNNRDEGSFRQLDPYIDFSALEEKKYVVQHHPTRFRKLIVDRLSDPNSNLKIINNAIAVKLITKKDNKISSLLYNKGGIEHKIHADVFIVSLGGLESPRLLLQSFKNSPLRREFIGKGLMDHPFAIIGYFSVPKYVFYKQHGRRKLLTNNSERIGYRVPNKFRMSDLNHSLFIRPGMSKDVEKTRKALKMLIYGKPSIRNIVSIISNPHIIKVAIGLLSERFGLGYFTKNFLISAQLEQFSCSASNVVLSNKYDKFNRQIPQINQMVSDEAMLDIQNMQNHFDNIAKDGCRFEKFELNRDDILPGAHYSGTCRMGSDKDLSVVDSNLLYHGIKNLYICDASVIPKIGNANLVYTISALALRLAAHLKKPTARIK